MVKLVQVPALHAEAVAGTIDVRPLLEAVGKRSQGLWTVEGMAARASRDEWQLWLIVESAVIGVCGSRLYLQDDGRKAAEILFAAGRDMSRWVHVIDNFEDWARREGCARITSVARFGWAKKLPGYRMTHWLLEKDLKDARR